MSVDLKNVEHSWCQGWINTFIVASLFLFTFLVSSSSMCIHWILDLFNTYLLLTLSYPLLLFHAHVPLVSVTSARRGTFLQDAPLSRRPFDRPNSHSIDKRGWNDGFKDYEMSDSVDDYELAESYGFGSLVPFLHSHFKTCPLDTPKTDCRPFYMPCKSDLACGISCRVNDYSCGSCSDTNSFRKVCQCCDLQPSAALVKASWTGSLQDSSQVPTLY